MEDIRSDRNGVDVDLRCGHKLLTVHLTREDARRDLRRDVTKPLFG